MVLIVFMMLAFVATAAITIDYSYMQLVRTELRSVADSAAKAGAESLSRTQSISTARSEAIRYAAANQVGGRAFQLAANDVAVGRVSAGSDGRWAFQANASPPNAVRVNARTGVGALHPSVPLFFRRTDGQTAFSPSYQATAGQQEVEVCLCLDRSGSMNFDMTGQDFSFASGNPFLSPFTAWGSIWQNMLSRPHPTQSRWAALTRAVDVFFQEASVYNPQPRTALVTWGSDYTMPMSPYTIYTASSTDVSLPAVTGFNWTANTAAITSSIAGRATTPIMGGTNLSAGLDRAVAVLNGTNSNSFSSKVIILLTDGEWNAGRNPINAAHDARAQGMIVHCVSMLTLNQTVLADVAELTGGRYFRTRNETELRAAFSEIAKSLPVVLTE